MKERDNYFLLRSGQLIGEGMHEGETNQLAHKTDYWMRKISCHPRYLQFGAYSGSENQPML